MGLNELKQKVSIMDLAANYDVIKINKCYRINPCPVCGHKDHFTIYPDTNSYSSFSNCCKGGSVLDFLIEVEGMSIEAAINELYSLAGEERPAYQEAQKKPLSASTNNDNTTNSLTSRILEWYEATYNDDELKKSLVQLMKNRYVRPDLVSIHKISIKKFKDGLRAIFPVWYNDEVVSYTARALENQTPKYLKPKDIAASEFYFNMDLLNEKESDADDPIFLTEGAIDALSLEVLGFKAIGLDSVKNLEAFIQKVTTHPLARNKEFLTAFDNDEEGLKATEKSSYGSITIPNEFKDVNEWLLDSIKKAKGAHTRDLAIEKDIHKQLEIRKQPDSVMAYLENGFAKDIEELSSYRKIKSGFDNIDKEITGIYPGLYVIGGISSVGKTTFVHQLADQIAEQGEHIIYFSLEQSRLEMVSKSLARETAKNDLNSAITSFSIRQGFKSIQLEKAIITYVDNAERVNIVEGNFGTTVGTMKAYINRYMQRNKVKPTVIVDYLQIIPADDPRMTEKQRTDYNVTELKRMSRDFNIPVMVISSLNRSNYLSPIDFESFKESGSIEYSADVIWGLQLEAIRDDLFNKEGKLKEKRELISQAKSQPIRQIELSCLKNRNGTPVFSCSFSYYAKYDYYEPNKINRYLSINGSNGKKVRL